MALVNFQRYGKNIKIRVNPQSNFNYKLKKIQRLNGSGDNKSLRYSLVPSEKMIECKIIILI